jgi:hypothetical protein
MGSGALLAPKSYNVQELMGNIKSQSLYNGLDQVVRAALVGLNVFGKKTVQLTKADIGKQR